MKTIPANTTEAHTIVLKSVIDDVRELLEWTATVILVVAVLNALGALSNALDGEWVRAGINAFLTAVMAYYARDSWRRSRKYHTGRRRKHAADPSARVEGGATS